MSGFSGIETNNKLDKLKLELEREMLKIVYDSYKNGYEEGALKNAPRAMENLPVAPVPCVRGIKMDTMKPLFLKLHEELTEFEFEIMQYMDTLDEKPGDVCLLLNENPQQHSFRIAEEGADVCTMVATILHAVGIDDKIRFDAQAYVNKHNHERGRN